MAISRTQEIKNNALIQAVVDDDKAAVRVALENGANPNTRWEPHGLTDDRNYTALHLAVQRQNVGVVKELLKAKDIHVNAKDGFGSTALTSATFMHLTSIVRALLEHPKINLNLKDEKQRTAWDHARVDGTEWGNNLRSLLTKKKADLSQKAEKVSWVEGEERREKNVQSDTKTTSR